jgi:hypothetical protein
MSVFTSYTKEYVLVEYSTVRAGSNGLNRSKGTGTQEIISPKLVWI